MRAVSGEKTAFAYSDDISLDALGAGRRRHPRHRARRAAPQVPARCSAAKAASCISRVDPLASLADADKVALLERLETIARALDPRVIQVMAQSGRRIRSGAGGAHRRP